jgi:hypothetical protein
MNQPQLNAFTDRFRAIGSLQFFENMADMGLNRVFGDE